jgi:hypothetical protein
MDAQLEATYEGPEAVQRLQLSITMTQELFLEQFRLWTQKCGNWPGRTPGPAPAPWPAPCNSGFGP